MKGRAGDAEVKMNAGHVVIPIFVPHEGCPFDCIFCNQKKISGRKEPMTVGAIREITESHLKTVRPGTILEIGFYGGSFTGIERSLQLEYLSAAFEYVRSEKVSAVRLSTRPDYIDNEILDDLEKYGVKTIELGVQSLDDGVLAASGRGHSAEDVYRASALIQERGFRLGLQTMVGLPGDTWEKDMQTARRIIGLKPGFVRIYPVLVIRDTYLEKLLREGTYAPPSLDEAVEICASLLEMYEAAGIKVIRVGLQSSEDINEASEVVAGPVHPAFRQLAEGRLALRRIETALESLDLKNARRIRIRTGQTNLSNVIGHRRSNLELLNKKYPGLQFKIEACDGFSKEISVIPAV